MLYKSKLRWLSSALLTLAFILLSCLASASTAQLKDILSPDRVARGNSKRVEPQQLFSSNGLTDEVQWDQYSLIVKGQRIFL